MINMSPPACSQLLDMGLHSCYKTLDCMQVAAWLSSRQAQLLLLLRSALCSGMSDSCQDPVACNPMQVKLLLVLLVTITAAALCKLESHQYQPHTPHHYNHHPKPDATYACITTTTHLRSLALQPMPQKAAAGDVCQHHCSNPLVS